MATGADAITAIADATGLLPATVGRAARALREAGGDLWPQSMPGGGRNANHVQPHHLVNLTLALMGADPLTDAPEAVSSLRQLRRYPAHPEMRIFILPLSPDYSLIEALAEQSAMLAETLEGLTTLGSAMDAMVQQLSYCANSGRAIVDDSVAIDLRTDAEKTPSASIIWRDHPTACQVRTYASRQQTIAGKRAYLVHRLFHGGNLDRTATVRGGLIAVLVDLWRDTINNRGAKRPNVSLDQATLDG